MLNNCLLTGNLGADPEVFYSSEGDPIATFNLAFRSSKKKTNWIKITCFNKLAEIVEKHLHRGARIGIIGTLDQQKWETDEGAVPGRDKLSQKWSFKIEPPILGKSG